MGMYKSPIELMITDIQHQIAKEQDNEIYKAVVHYIPNIDKEELLRALQYDRDQYNKGYADGKADAMPKWIPVTERLPEEKVNCIVHYKHAYCDNDDYWAIGICFYDGKKFQMDWTYKVTHWMPLPEPPKGE